MTTMVVVVRVGFVQRTPYRFPENQEPTIFVDVFNEIVTGRRAIITAREEGNIFLQAEFAYLVMTTGQFSVL